MKKCVMVFISATLILTMLLSCTPSVPQEDYDELSLELEYAETRVRLLQSELDKLTSRRNKAVLYSIFLDLVLYPFFVTEQDVTLRANFENETAWFEQMRSNAGRLGDERLVEMVDQFEKREISISIILDYLITTLEETLG